MMVKVAVLLVPPGVVTVSVRAPGMALDPMVSGTVTQVELAEVTLPTVTPVPEMATLISGVKFAPLMVTLKVLASPPVAGLALAKVGAGGAVMEKATAELVMADGEPGMETCNSCCPIDPLRPRTATI